MECGSFATSNAFGELIFEYNLDLERQLEKNPDVCVKKLDGRFAVAYYRREDMDLSITRTGYFAVPKLYAPMDTTAVEAVGATWGFRQPALGLKGNGVLIGVIDSGIDLSHSAFFDSAGNSRVTALWDQTDESGNPPKRLGYGSVYNSEQINALLQEEEADLPGKDETGHGTFLAGLAAGSEDLASDFVGAAPETSLAVVKLKPAKSYLRAFYFVKEGAECYQESDVMAALAFLTEVQLQERKPMVVLFGFGSSMGGHAGNTALAQMMERMSDNRGTVIVVPTGNEANASHHYQGQISSLAESERVEFRVPEGSRGVTIEFWGGISERYQIAVRSPGGEMTPIGMIGLTDSDRYRFYREGTTVYVDTFLEGNRSEGQLILIRLEKPAPGVWEIEVRGQTLLNGRYHMWLPVSALVEEGTVFLRPSPDVTLTEPATAKSTIGVAGYNHRNGGIYLESGRGYNRLEEIRPDVAAPAVSVYGPLPKGRYGNRSGTSAAAALTAGICADLLEWGIVRGEEPYLNQARMRDYLIRGAGRMKDRRYPNREWGYGTVSLEGVFRAIQG